MSESVYLITLCLPLGTLLLIFGMKYFATIRQAQGRAAQDEAYRKLAERAAQTEAGAAAMLAAIQGSLAGLEARMASIEKILKDVE